MGTFLEAENDTFFPSLVLNLTRVVLLTYSVLVKETFFRLV